MNREPYPGPYVLGKRRGWWWSQPGGEQRWTLFLWWARYRTARARRWPS
jgi:hypothetical protein